MHSIDDPPSRSGDLPPSRTSAKGDTPYTGAWTGGVTDDEDELVGTTLCNTYVIERVLGEGGMGRVYLARHTRIQRKSFAIKTLHPEYLRSPDVVRRFGREAEAAAAIKSEHVVGVYDVDKAPDGRPFLVAELLDGSELGDLLEARGKLAIPYAVNIVRQICKALSAAHEQGVIHRDMKPENVFLTGDVSQPLVKVLDFGISRLDDGDGQGLTKTGMIMGTPSYMPPEQARGEHVDLRADIYSVGAILYTALTGRVPFDRDDPAATVVAVLTQDPMRPRAIEPTIPEHLEAIVQRAMAKKPDDRYASMGELYEALALYDTGEVGALAAPLLTGDPRTRALTLSRDTLEQQARVVREARPLFVTLLALTVTALIAGMFTAAAGVVAALRGFGPSNVELFIGAVALFAALSTPSFLVARHIKRTSWDNSMRMVELADALKPPLAAGAATYGVGALLVAVVDHLLWARAPWPLWDALVLLLALTSAALASAARKKGSRLATLKGPLPSIALGAVTLALGVGGAIGLRADTGEAVAVNGSAAPVASASVTASASVEPSAPASASANEAELATAKKGGADALDALAKRFPKDAAVLRALVVARGAANSHDTVEALERLHGVDASALQDDVIIGITKGAADDPEQRKKALVIMGTMMGSKGPDVLYDLSLSSAASRADAKTLLTTEAVRKSATPALLIAFDLREAASCSAKAELLTRVGAEGDQRCVLILQPLVAGSKSGCGFLKLGGCPAKCAKEAARMQQAIAAIRARAE